MGRGGDLGAMQTVFALEFCHVADAECQSPPGHRRGIGYNTSRLGRDPAANFECYQCGLAVCENCSVIEEVRRCKNCLQENKRSTH